MKRIALHDRGGVIVAYALVDSDIFTGAGQLGWYLGSNGYVVRNTPERTTELLHRRVMGLVDGDGLEVDHRDGNTLDNRRFNLRMATRSQQLQNMRAPVGRSRHRGVWLHSCGRWNAQVQVDGRRHHLGLWDTEEEAAAAASGARRVLMPFAEQRSA